MLRRKSLLVGLVVAAAGCSPTPPRQYTPDTLAAAEQFKKVSTAYMQAYQAKKKPPEPNDLKPFLKNQGETLESLVSRRDNKPIALAPFVPDAKLADGEEPILAYESQGVGGERMVVDSHGLVRLVKNEDFAKIKFAGGHKPK